jgi:RNA polymerase sigma factor (TIGR02999 family)
VTSDPASREISRILRAASDGNHVDEAALLPLVYDHLRAIAARQMERERDGHILQATALVHEAYLRLVGRESLAWTSKAHFYGAAAEAMRRILLDHARARDTLKRGGKRVRLALDIVDLATRESPAEILAVDEALSRLERQDARMASIVKLRFFAGLSEKEASHALGVSPRTLRREWTIARAFLHRELSRE